METLNKIKEINVEEFVATAIEEWNRIWEHTPFEAKRIEEWNNTKI